MFSNFISSTSVGLGVPKVAKQFKVAVVGAAGGIGQPLSLLLKLNKTGHVGELNLYDLSPVTPGVSTDLSHIPTNVKVNGFTGDNSQLALALKDADLILVPAGVPRKPGMTRDDLFNINAGINYNVATVAAEVAPNAAYAVISNPVNSTVPIWAGALKKAGVYNPKKLFGVTELDQFRANTFASQALGLTSPVSVPVVGGHAGITIVPLFSQIKEGSIPEDQLEALTHRVAFGGDEVVQAKNGAGSATLSMAAAGASFAEKVLTGLSGTPTNALAYVENAGAKRYYGTDFFASPVVLGASGLEHIDFDIVNSATAFEKAKIEAAIPDLLKQIKKGEDFVTSKQ